MKVQYRILIGAVIAAAAVFLFRALIGGSTVTLFMPEGAIAGQQLRLIETEVLIMLCIAVPMLILLFTFAWRYRAGNPKVVRHDPEPSHRAWLLAELVMWVIPAVVVAMLGTLVWKSAHALDPYKPIDSTTPPLTVEVVALTWKWLFIYPAQNIATVNFLEFPENTPVHFELTADAPMSSFWIPQLGSQIYAMAAMETQLSLIASTTGEFTGKDTEINGEGYAGMQFTAKSVSQADFNAWMQSVQASTSTYPALTLDVYNALTAPSEYNPPAYYSSVQGNMFDNIIMKFMMPTSTMDSGTDTADWAIPQGMQPMQPVQPMQNMPSTSSMQDMPGMQNMPGMQM